MKAAISTLISLLIIIFPNAVKAEASASKQGFSLAASALLDAMKENTPQVDDPLVQSYMSQVNGLTRNLGTPAEPASSVEEYNNLCGVGTKIAIGYLLSGAKGLKSEINSSPKPEKILIDAMNAFIAKNIDFVIANSLFVIHCQAAFSPIIDAQFALIDMSNDPAGVRKDGLVRMKNGQVGLIKNALVIASAQGTREGLQEQVIAQLEVDWDGLILLMDAETRGKTKVMIAQALPLLPIHFQERVEQLATRIDAVPCENLCSLHFD